MESRYIDTKLPGKFLDINLTKLILPKSLKTNFKKLYIKIIEEFNKINENIRKILEDINLTINPFIKKF